MKRKLKMGIGKDRDTARGFIETWQGVKQGEGLYEPEERITFENMQTLLSILTPKRWLILETLKKQGPASVRSLARVLGRDYKTVHTSIKILESTGLVERTEDGLVMVPWTTLVAEVKLAA